MLAVCVRDYCTTIMWPVTSTATASVATAATTAAAAARAAVPTTTKALSKDKKKGDPSQALVKAITQSIKDFEKQDKGNWFQDQVTDSLAPRYSELITKPMWIGRIKEKLRDVRGEVLCSLLAPLGC